MAKAHRNRKGSSNLDPIRDPREPRRSQRRFHANEALKAHDERPPAFGIDSLGEDHSRDLAPNALAIPGRDLVDREALVAVSPHAITALPVEETVIDRFP